MSHKDLQGRPEVKIRFNIVRERLNFNSYKFDKGETIDTHVNALRNLASTCGFENAESRIIEKVLSEYPSVSNDIIEKLDQDQYVSLELLLDLIRVKENDEIPNERTDDDRGLEDCCMEQSDNDQSVEDDFSAHTDNDLEIIAENTKILTRDEVDFIVVFSLNNENPMSLGEVKTLLERKYQCSFSQDDKIYIEEIYSEIILELWLDEVSENIMNSDTNPVDYIHQLKPLETLQDCLSFNYLQFTSSLLLYNNLLIELIKTSKEYISIHEKVTVSRFKSTIMAFLKLKSTHLQSEIDFYKSLVKTLKSSKNVSELCCALHMTEFLDHKEDETIRLKELLKDIIDCYDFQDTHNLKAASQAIVSQERYYFVKFVEDVIAAYLKPLVITERSCDGRKILEIKGEHIVIKQIKENIERTPEFNGIEEVRFVNSGVIHIDEDLDSKLWHGKNVVVYTETAIVSKDKIITWDLSGLNAQFVGPEKAGTSSEGIGLDGANGKSGESGGNFLLICDDIENASFLKITCNGGKGSNGQAGGDGLDGPDGDFVDEFEFKKRFPPPSKFFDDDKKKNLGIIKSSILNDVKTVKLSVLGQLIPVSVNDFDGTVSKQIEKLTDMYFEIKTNTECQVLFSFYSANQEIGFCQSFLIHKGSNGTPGKQGGKGGSGGKGGFPGEVVITTNNNLKIQETGIIIHANKGEDGKQGVSGASGKPGKSGCDRAFIDCTKPKFPFLNDVKFPKYFSTDSLSSHRLKVEYYPTEAPERIYCPHNSQYAAIETTTKTWYENCLVNRFIQQTSKKDLTESNFQLQVNRKKTINKKSIIEQYEHEISGMDYKKLESIDKDISKVYEEICNEEQLCEEKLTTKEMRITRKIEFYCDGTLRTTVPFTANYDLLNKTISGTSSGVESFTEKGNNLMADNFGFYSILQAKLDLQGLNLFWTTSGFQNIYLSKNKSTNETQLLCDKYHLATLYSIEKTFSSLKHHSLTPGSFIAEEVGLVERTLSITEQHQCHGELERYLCNDSEENRLSVIRKLEESASDSQFCMNIFNLYLDEYSELDDCEKFLSNSQIHTYKKHYNWFKWKKAKGLHSKFVPLLYHVSGNEEMYNELVKAITEHNLHLKIDIEHKIRSNPYLYIFYEKYKEEVNKPFVWKSILVSKEDLSAKLVEGFKLAILQKGPFSVFFREVVAGLFKTNVRIYTKNDCKNEMVLVHNHNPTASEVVHFLIKDNKYYKLQTEEGLSEVIRGHKVKGQLCSRIQLQVDLIKSFDGYKEEFEKFVSESSFLSDSQLGLCKSNEIRTKVCHIMKEDENIDLIANAFHSVEDKSLLRSRLKMLKHEYIGYQSCLYYIALHIKTEGIQMTATELCCIVNFLLKSVLDSSSETNILSWIIAAHHQKDWLVEFIMFKLELYFRTPLDSAVKDIWTDYLLKTNRDTRIMLFNKLCKEDRLLRFEDAEEILLLISLAPSHIEGLSQLRLVEWKYYLKDIFWSDQMKNTGNWSVEELKEASYYLSLMENTYGKELCCKFIEVVKSQCTNIRSDDEKKKILNTLKCLIQSETLVSGGLLQLLSQVSVDEWETVVHGSCVSVNGQRGLDELKELIKSNSNTSLLINMNIDASVNSVEMVKVILNFLKVKFTKQSELEKWISGLLNIFDGNIVPMFVKEKSAQRSLKINHQMHICFQEMLEKVVKDGGHHIQPSDFVLNNVVEIFLATVCVAIFIMFENKVLRNTQLLAIIIFLNTNKNILGQVSTGEGKTFIIIAVAIMKALAGSKVDIITSSHVLAKRDADKHAQICRMFHIEAGHNCSENIEERKKTYSNCHIVYGELTYFQRDFLLDRAYNNNILGDRTFETILIDEVDSMLLDRANNVLYLSHDIPGLDKLELLFVFIWKLVNSQKIFMASEDVFFNIDEVKDKIIDEMFGQIKVEDIRNLDSHLKDSVFQTLAHLKKEGIIDSSGKLLYEHYDEIKEEKVVKCVHGEGVKYLLKKILSRKKEFEIPNYLKKFAEDHLDKWINSAINAVNLKNNIDYVIDVDRSNVSSDRTPNIIIVDRDTGTDLKNSQWDQGLHQFLQLKHGCRLSPLTFKAVFISNVSYLKMYKTLLGLTGTLGTINDRDLLKEVYNVEFVTIPTAKSKQFCEYAPVLCNNSDDWSCKIVEKVYEVTDTRSVLIICQSLNEVFILKKSFEAFMSKKQVSKREILTYTRDYEEFDQKSLGVGKIIISTNLAGRGTDIQLSEKLIENSGLHVCLTFLPDNSRIEEQAFGRCARNGQPGSGQIIFKASGTNSVSRIIDIKKERNANETLRLSNLKDYYETKIKLEEELFLRFLEVYKSLGESKHCQEVKSILQRTCLDKWAFFLESSPVKTQPYFEALLKNITKLNSDDLSVWKDEIKDPFQLTKLGVYYLGKENKKALQLFDHVIKKEPNFSEAAYYYRACAIANISDISQYNLPSLIHGFEIVKEKLKKRIESLESAMFIDEFKNYNNQNVIQIDSFKSQQLIKCITYQTFVGSVDNIIGCAATPEAFCPINFKSEPKIGLEETSSALFKDLVKNNVIQLKVKDGLSERDVYFSYEHGLCPKRVEKLFNSNVFQRELGNQEMILKILKETLSLRSRELFWHDLISVGILENEEKFVFINHEKLSRIDPSCVNQIQPLAVDINFNLKNRVLLYTPEEIGIDGEFQKSNWLFVKEALKTKLGERRYTFLKDENVMFFNNIASFTSRLLETVELNHFDSVTSDDFLNIGVPSNVVPHIIDNLIKENIIGVKNKCNPTQYLLLANFAEIDEININSYVAYQSDVRSLLKHCFSFRIAVQKLQDVVPLCEGNYTNLVIPLPIFLNNRFWSDLKEHNIVEHKVNSKETKLNSKLKYLYSKSKDKDHYINLFSKLYEREKSEDIVEELISKEWLKKDIQVILSENYCVNYLKKQNGSYKLNTKKALSGNLKCESDTIQLILLRYLGISLNVESLEETVKFLAGEIHEVETPSFSLTPLEKVLTDTKIPISEIDTFNLNGFNQLIKLEEKKYTRKMVTSMFCISAVALAQIATGVCLGPFGAKIIESGINDVIFIGSCLMSGFFSLREYMKQKVINIIFSCFSFYAKNKSLFASKHPVMTIQSMKEKALSVVSKSSIYCEQTTKTQIITQIAKRVVVHAAEGCAYAASFTFIDTVLRPQEENLDDILTGLIYHDIDQTIINHCLFETVTELFIYLDEPKARNIIQKSTRMMTFDYEAKIQNSCESLKKNIFLNCERICSKGFSMKRYSPTDCQHIIEIFNKIRSTLPQALKHVREISTLVDDILTSINNSLLIELKRERKEDIHGDKRETDLPRYRKEKLSIFKNSVSNEINDRVKNVVSSYLRENFILPILQFVRTRIENLSAQMISKSRNTFLNNGEILKTKKDKKKSKNSSGVKTNIKRSKYFSDDFDDITRGVLKIRRNVKLLSYLVSQDKPMDTYCIELCCKAISLAAKEERVKIPSLRIVIDRNGMQEVFGIGHLRNDTATLHISQDHNLQSNVKNNESLIVNFFTYLADSFLENYPEYNGFTASFLKEMVIKGINMYCRSQSCNTTTESGIQVVNDKWDSKGSHSCKLSSGCDGKAPYQLSLCEGGWIFNPRVDVNLHDKEKHLKVIDIERHVKEGFETALDRINMHIHGIQSCLISYNLGLGDFAITKYQLAPPSHSMLELISCIAVKYELVLPVVLKEIDKQVDFNITMQLQNKNMSKSILAIGPHILYEVNPSRDPKFLSKGVKGRILLNMHCTDNSYSVEQCRIAGELIVASPLLEQVTRKDGYTSICEDPMAYFSGGNLKSNKVADAAPSHKLEPGEADGSKESNTLIIGDSLFKYIEDYVRLPNCVFGIFPHLKVNLLKAKVMSLLPNCSRLKCVVIFFGNDVVKSSTKEQELLSCILEVLKDLQGVNPDVQVVVCTLLFPRQLSDRNTRKILNANKVLMEFCRKENWFIIDTSKIICDRDFGKNGIHLNRSGYDKIGRNISRVVQENKWGNRS